MSIFDSLISKNNKEPKDIEYIYNLDLAWVKDKLDCVDFKKGSIVTNVTKLENNSYSFIFENNEYKTNYGWSLIENTSENLDNLNAYDKLMFEIKKFEDQASILRKNIKTL